MAEKTDLGLSGLFGAIGSVITAAINKKSAKEQAESNEKIAQQQIDAQQEANLQQQQFESEQAELAYARSQEQSQIEFDRTSSLGQLKQLTAAGLSEQQARQVLASKGSTGVYTPAVYTPAESVNQMQGVDYNNLAAAKVQSMQADADYASAWTNSSMNLVGQLGSSLVESYTSPTGGQYGLTVAQSLLTHLNNNLHLLDKSEVTTFADLLHWLSVLPDDEKYDPFRTKQFKRAIRDVKNFAPAAIATNSYMNTLWSANLDFSSKLDLNLKKSVTEQNTQALQEQQKFYYEQYIKNLQVELSLDQEQILNLREQRKLVSTEQQKVISEIANLAIENRILNTDYVRNSIQNRMLQEQEFYINEYEISRMQALTKQFLLDADWYSDPKNVQVYLKHLTSTKQGEIAAALLAAMQNDNVRERVENSPFLSWLSSIHNSLNGAGFQIVNSTAGSVGAAGLLIKALKTVPK